MNRITDAQLSLLKTLDHQGKAVVTLQKELVARPALGPDNGGSGEGEKADFLYQALKDLGISDLTVINAPDSRLATGVRPNIVARIPGRDQETTLWIVSHMDVVPPGESSLWHTDPFELSQDGDLIYGRGVEDNHHGLVASFLAAKTLVDSGTTPRTNLGLLFVADEETGNDYGLKFVLDHHEHIFGPNDRFLVPDFGTPDSGMVEVAEKSLLWLKFTLTGRQCHASTPGLGLNTFVATADLVLRLRQLYTRFDMADDRFDPPFSTFEATKKEANVPNVNSIPGRDVFYLDCRILPDIDLQDVLQAVDELSRETSETCGVTVNCDIVHRESSPPTPEDHPLIKELMQAVEAVVGHAPRPQGIGGGTVAALPRKKGYPATVWATLLGNAHQPNEHTSINSILQDAKVMTLLCL